MNDGISNLVSIACANVVNDIVSINLPIIKKHNLINQIPKHIEHEILHICFRKAIGKRIGFVKEEKMVLTVLNEKELLKRLNIESSGSFMYYDIYDKIFNTRIKDIKLNIFTAIFCIACSTFTFFFLINNNLKTFILIYLFILINIGLYSFFGIRSFLTYKRLMK